MGTICLYETPGTNWSGSGGLYDLICEYALNHPRVQALPEFAQALQDSLWYKGYLPLRAWRGGHPGLHRGSG